MLEHVAFFIYKYVMAVNVPGVVWSAMRALGLDEVARNDAAQGNSEGKENYEPSPVDIAVVRAMLFRAKKLPPDLVDAIFDFAEYWAHTTTELHERMNIMGGNEERENRFLVRFFSALVAGPCLL